MTKSLIIFGNWNLIIGHYFFCLALPLLVLAIHTNHPDDFLPAHNFAFRADFLYGSPDFHFSLLSVNYPAPGQVIRGEFELNPIPGQDLNVMHPHPPRNMRQDPVSVIQFHPEHGVGEGFHYFAFNFDQLFFRHLTFDLESFDLPDLGNGRIVAFSPHALRTIGPSAVAATVCSKWAERLRSRVTTVQPSGRVSTS